jgi:hypothetical protein
MQGANPEEVFFDSEVHALRTVGKEGWEGNVYHNSAARTYKEIQQLAARRKMGETLTEAEHRRREWHADLHGSCTVLLIPFPHFIRSADV